MKNERQRKIVEIVSVKNVGTQAELTRELRLAGFHATQATVSRDIRELRLVKELDPSGEYRYIMPADPASDMETLRNIFRECVTNYVCAQNIVVIKTLPGLAPAACIAIDKMDIKDMAGTIAGDDTAFLAMRDNEAAQRLYKEIKEYL